MKTTSFFLIAAGTLIGGTSMAQELRSDSTQQRSQQRIERSTDRMEQKGDSLNVNLHHKAGELPNQDAEDASSVKKDAPETMKTGAERQSNTWNSESVTDSTGVTSSAVEILDTKEGPNNEVVYKFHNELYYVDRNNKQLVKAEESQLKDAKNKVVVKTYTGTAKSAERNSKKVKRPVKG